MQDWMVR